MSRAQIIGLSIVCCLFGLVSLDGPEQYRNEAYAMNVALAIACYVVAGRDLVRRGWSLGYLFAGTYLLPLVGLIVYVGLSNRPVQEPVAADAP